VYEAPSTEFVAGFVGTASVLDGDAARALVGADGPFSVRPERIRIVDDATPAAADVRASGEVVEVQYHGDGTRVRVALDAGASLLVEVANATDQLVPRRGERVAVEFSRADALAVGGVPA
jgi:putative spermidine/putrescine transport system ATP-binding protein